MADLAAVVDDMTLAPKTVSVPSLFIDLEGIKLSRHGSVSLLSIFIHGEVNRTAIIDIHKLGASAFCTTGKSNPQLTLAALLCDPNRLKGFFDMRNDSNALFFHFGIELQGVVDLQLMELGSRYGQLSAKRCLSGLAKCIATDAPLTKSQRRPFEFTKEKGLNFSRQKRVGVMRFSTPDHWRRTSWPTVQATCDFCTIFTSCTRRGFPTRLGGGKKWTLRRKGE
ncbi:hypothetical protein MMC19_004334 [Ptychographa xylographoides]|nr:hypothetical protein [Ptychographa xylographoides]